MILTTSTQEYLQIIEKALNIVKKTSAIGEVSLDTIKTILTIQADLNEKFFFTRSFSMLCYRENELEYAVSDIDSFCESVSTWEGFIREIVTLYLTEKNMLDASFIALMNYLSISDENSLVLDMTYNLKSLPKDTIDYLCDFYTRHDFLWKSLDIATNNIDVILDRVSVIKEYTNEFLWLYERLADNRSKAILLSILKNWVSFQEITGVETCFPEYRDFDLINTLKSGVIVDCGAFNGDSAIAFSESYPTYESIYCFEASPTNFADLTENTKKLRSINCIQKAVGEDFGSITIGNDGVAGSLLKGGDVLVDLVPIDEEVKEPISLVKMDIEGAEQGALKGMKEHIIADKPDMIICVYHGNRDIIEIPRLIDEIRDDYKFYLRYSGRGPVPIDFTLYAV